MRHIISLFLALIFLNACVTPDNRTESILSLEQQIPQWLALYNVAGAAMAIIEDGEIVSLKGYGFSDLDTKAPVTLNTGFNIGSISKTLTAWGIMQLVEDQQLDLDAPLSKYLTKWQLPESPFDVEKVTIRGLLSHTAGISLHGFRGFSLGDSLPSILEMLDRKDRDGQNIIRQISEPGVNWRYSGGGYLILQLLIEEVSGMSFEAYMQEAVIRPLGMTHSGFEVDSELLEASSSEYNTMGKKLPFQIFTATGAAGFQTTIEDFTQFALSNLGKHQEVLDTSTLAKMMAPDSHTNETYGLGYQIEIFSNEVRMVGHAGANLGWHAFYRIDPVRKNGFIMFTNSGYGWNVYRKAFGHWLQNLHGIPLGNDYKTSIMAAIIAPLNQEGATKAIQKYQELKSQSPQQFDINANQLVGLGTVLIRQKRFEDAIEILEFNAREFPGSARTFNTLGNAYHELGVFQKAIESYRRSLEIDSTNMNIRKQLDALLVN